MSACKLCNGVRFMPSPTTGVPVRCPCASGQTIALLMLEPLAQLPGPCSSCGKSPKTAGGMALTRRSWLADGAIVDGWGLVGEPAAMPALALRLCSECSSFVITMSAAQLKLSAARSPGARGPFVRSCGLLGGPRVVLG